MITIRGQNLVSRTNDDPLPHPCVCTKRPPCVDSKASPCVPASETDLVVQVAEARHTGACTAAETGVNWEFAICELMIAIGFVQGGASPCICRHLEKQLRVGLHGDDFVPQVTSSMSDGSS